MLAVYIMTFIFGTAFYLDLVKDDRCEGDIVDIYYPADLAENIYDMNCPFTKTLIDCKIVFNQDKCNVYYISRKHYDRHARSFTKLRMQPRFPRRTDVDRLYEPVNKGYTGG